MKAPTFTPTALLLAAACSPLSLFAAAWSGSDGNFTDASSWGGTVPNSSTTAEIKNGSTVTINSNVSPKNLEIAGSSIVNQTAGNVTFSDQSRIGLNGIGYYNVTGGTISSSSTMRIGQNTDGNGSMVLSGSASFHQTNTGSSGHLWLANGTNSTGSLTLKDNASWTIDGTGSDGVHVGRWSNTGTANATLTLEGNAVFSTKSEVAIGNSGSNGTISMSGNTTLQANKFWKGTGTATFNVNGGTIKATVDQTNFLENLTVTLGANGATIDTSGASIVDATDTGKSSLLTGIGGLTKAGDGTLTLNHIHDYTGATVVKKGTLVIEAGGSLSGSSSIEVLADAALVLTDPNQISYTSALRLAADSSLELDFFVSDVLEVGMLFIAGQAVAAGEYDAIDFAQWLADYNITVDLGAATGTTIQVNAVPEPSTYALFGTAGLAGLIFLRRRKS